MSYTQLDHTLPGTFSSGSRVGAGSLTHIVPADNGLSGRFSRLVSARKRFEVMYDVQDQESVAALINFYHAVWGPYGVFKHTDPLDNSSAADGRSAPAVTDQSIVQDDAGNWRLAKAYGPVTKYILLPYNVTLSAGGVMEPGGIVTGASAAPGNTAGFNFYLPVRFEGGLHLEHQEVDGDSESEDRGFGRVVARLIEKRRIYP